MPWQEARRRLRIIPAAEALATLEAAVTEIALEVGYASSSGFNAAFRDVMCTTPSEFRASPSGGRAREAL